MGGEADDVALTQLTTATGLHLTVDGDRTGDHQRLGVGAVLDEVRQLQELAEADRVLSDCDITRLGHSSILPHPAAPCRTPPHPAAPRRNGAGQRRTLTVWITTPTSPPTIVPLIRMNCRSRPTCSSILRAASLPSQRLTVCVMIAVSSAPYRVTANTAKSAA